MHRSRPEGHVEGAQRVRVAAAQLAGGPGVCTAVGTRPHHREAPGREGRAPRRCLGPRALDAATPLASGWGVETALTVDVLRARIVCGGANNQLVTEGDGGTADRLVARGITYAPDFLVNAGGVIQVSDELHGFDFERAKRGATAIFEHTLEVLRTADERGESPAAAADHVAEQRMAAGSPTIWLPQG